MKTRTKQMQSLIDDANYYLKATNTTDKGNDLFLCITNNLIRQDLYKGFNYYKRNYLEQFDPITGKDEIITIDVTCTESDAQFLQIL